MSDYLFVLVIQLIPGPVPILILLFTVTYNTVVGGFFQFRGQYR